MYHMRKGVQKLRGIIQKRKKLTKEDKRRVNCSNRKGFSCKLSGTNQRSLSQLVGRQNISKY